MKEFDRQDLPTSSCAEKSPDLIWTKERVNQLLDQQVEACKEAMLIETNYGYTITLDEAKDIGMAILNSRIKI